MRATHRQVILQAIPSPGLLPIPQRVWQDLQPSDRNDLHKLAVDKGLYLFGAQVDDGDDAFETITIDCEDTRGYIRIVGTIAGTSPSVAYGVHGVGFLRQR